MKNKIICLIVGMSFCSLALSVERNSALINKVMNLKNKTDRPYLFETVISTKIEKEAPVDSIKSMALDTQYSIYMKFLAPKDKGNFKNYVFIITKDTFPVFKRKFQQIKSNKDFVVLSENVRLNKEGTYQFAFFYNEVLEESFEVIVQKNEEKYPEIENILAIEKNKVDSKVYGGQYTDKSFNSSAIKDNKFEYVNLDTLLEKSCIGNLKIVKKEIRSDNIETLKDISLKNIQSNFDKGIAPSKDEYFDGDAILRVKITKTNYPPALKQDEKFYEASINKYDVNTPPKDYQYRNFIDFSMTDISFTKFVDIEKVALNMIYKNERTGKGGGTVGNEGVDQAFKIYKKDHDFYMEFKSKSMRQWTHMPIAMKMEFEFNCKFQPEDPVTKKNKEDEEKFKSQFKK